jgi:hypothetical protein
VARAPRTLPPYQVPPTQAFGRKPGIWTCVLPPRHEGASKANAEYKDVSSLVSAATPGSFAPSAGSAVRDAR